MRTPPHAEHHRGVSFDSLSDAELIARIGQRDHEAFDALYRRFARRILALAVRRLKDRGSAEDATQDAFVAVWRRAATYRPERGPVAPWLFAIARNTIVDRARARVNTVADVGDEATNEPGPAEQAEREWLRRRVHAAVEELPQDERTLIELAYWSDLTQSEISARLGIPLGTVKTGTRRGLARLATLLGDGAM